MAGVCVNFDYDKVGDKLWEREGWWGRSGTGGVRMGAQGGRRRRTAGGEMKRNGRRWTRGVRDAEGCGVANLVKSEGKSPNVNSFPSGDVDMLNELWCLKSLSLSVAWTMMVLSSTTVLDDFANSEVGEP